MGGVGGRVEGNGRGGGREGRGVLVGGGVVMGVECVRCPVWSGKGTAS